MFPGWIHHFRGLLFVPFPILHYINLQVEMINTCRYLTWSVDSSYFIPDTRTWWQLSDKISVYVFVCSTGSSFVYTISLFLLFFQNFLSHEYKKLICRIEVDLASRIHGITWQPFWPYQQR